ncbi:MAG: selenium-dependent molybdenum cofactor biosynthesis protein YqeB [Halanaerobium sp.]|nr:selenium-dependent molybdenum cofactor biosynthesis protein YqeB [Halanaerobium sp.]
MVYEEDKAKIFIKGGGDLATGVACRLYQAGFAIAMSELDKPLAVRRPVSFAEAVYQGDWTVEGIKASFVRDEEDFWLSHQEGLIPVVPAASYQFFQDLWKPDVIVDGRMMKRANDTFIDEAPLVIGLGPGFNAGSDVDAVIETARGHYLGRAIWQGQAQPNTGRPGEIMGFSRERVLFSPAAGLFQTSKKIGELVEAGEVCGQGGGVEVKAKIPGIIRGVLKSGLEVTEGMKIGDVDPRGKREYCFTVSDKALAVGGGVLEAVMSYLSKRD